MLYKRTPVSPWQMFFMRSVMCIGILTLHVNVKLKKETWDPVSCKNVGPLAFKTGASCITNLIQFSVTMFIPATIISIVSNLAPIIVVILAFLILKEEIRKFDVLMILMTLVGIFTIILGGDSDNNDKAVPSFGYWVIYLLLFFNPFLSAGGTVAMRKAAKFGDSIVGWYLQWAMLIVSTTLILATGEGFSIFGTFGWQEWLLAFGTGFTSVYSETARFVALKLYKAAALQKLVPLQTMFQWIFDITIFKIHYNWIQDIGLAYLALIYIFQGLKYAMCDAKAKEKKQEEHKLKQSILRSQSTQGARPD